MTIPSHPSHPIPMRDGMLTRRQARRMSRRFEDVGVTIAPTRLQHLTAGAEACDVEVVNIRFALAAIEMQHEQRLAKRRRGRRRGAYWAIVGGLGVLLLSSLLAMAYLVFSLALHAYPY